MPDEKLGAEKMHIRCSIIIEVLGKPKEHVERAVREYVEKIKIDSDIIVMKADFADAREKEGLWATFVELDVVVKGIPKLISFCFDYMPSSVEILKPEDFVMKKSTVEDLLNDLQARLHQVDMIIKKQKNENEFLKHNLNKAVSNAVLLSLVSGSLDKERLSKATGISEEELEIFLDNLIKENKIIKEGEIYTLSE